MKKILLIMLILFTALAYTGCNKDGDTAGTNRGDSAYRLAIDLTGSLQNPAFSPDGESIVFTRFRNGYNLGPADLYLFHLQTRKLTRLVSNGSANINLPGSAWRGDSIVYASDKGEHDEIYRVERDSQTVTQITDRETKAAYEPSFSPDGTQIVFESHPLDVEGKGVITKYRIDGSGGYTALTPEGEDARQPNWSPDGSKILYQKHVNGHWEIWTMDAEGNNPLQVTGGDGDKTDASFSRDGKKIVYSADTGLEYANIFEYDLGSGTTTRLTRYDTGYDGAVSLSPDGSLIAFESTAGEPDASQGSTLWALER